MIPSEQITGLLRSIADEMDARGEPEDDYPLTADLKGEFASWLTKAVYDLGHAHGRLAEREAQAAKKTVTVRRLGQEGFDL